MENFDKNHPGILSLYSERLLLTGGLDLLNEALNQSLSYLEILISKTEESMLIKPLKVAFFLNNHIFLVSRARSFG